MNNKRSLALVPSFFIMMFFIVTGLRTLIRYGATPGDWHFIAGSIGLAGFVFLFVVLGIAVLKKLGKDKKVEGCDATEVK